MERSIRRKRKDRYEQALEEWKQKNVIGFMLWEMYEETSKSTLQAHQTREGVALVQIFENKEFIVFKQQ